MRIYSIITKARGGLHASGRRSYPPTLRASSFDYVHEDDNCFFSTCEIFQYFLGPHQAGSALKLSVDGLKVASIPT
jgi:hypothetical protein